MLAYVNEKFVWEHNSCCLQSVTTNGVDVKTVSTALGHSQVSTTTNIYAHTFAKVQAEASDAIAKALPLKSHA